VHKTIRAYYIFSKFFFPADILWKIFVLSCSCSDYAWDVTSSSNFARSTAQSKA